MGKDDKLQRYFDGELPQEERAAFEASMTEEDRDRLAALAEMRALLSNALGGASAEVDVWPAVEAQLGGVVPIDAARAKRRRSVGRWFGTSAGLLVAAAAAFLFVVRPWHPGHPTDDCDIESLEVEGAVATVMQVNDMPHSGDATTIIWTSEED